MSAAAPGGLSEKAQRLHAFLEERGGGGRWTKADQEDRLVRQVAGALHAWRSRPELHEPAGATLPELEQELEEIEREATETGLPEGAAAERRIRDAGALGATGGRRRCSRRRRSARSRWSCVVPMGSA